MQWQWQLADASGDRRRLVVDALGALAHARQEPVRRVSRVLLDTFDERLADAGLVLEAERRKRAAPALILRGAQLAQREHWHSESLPLTASDIPRPRVAARVARVTEDRALLPVCSATGDVYRVQWFDALDKRIGAAEIFHVTPRRGAPALLFVDVQPVRGFEQACARLLHGLRRGVLADASAIDPALALRELRGGPRYRAKPVVEMHGRRPAADALAALFAAYGEVMWANERGIVEDLDAEFLHDYRVALRSLRSWVGDLRKVLARPARARVKTELAALNRVTGRLRDLDVLRAALPGHLAALGGVDAAQAARLAALVERARDEARHQLQTHLHASAYRKFRHRWRQLCRRLAAGRGLGRDGESPLRAVVTTAIERRLRDILAFDWADAEREPALLHELRKECKKLRYLLEGFQKLFDPGLCRRAIAELKSVQTAMGDTWDLHVHHALLQDLGAGLDADDARVVLPIVVGLGTRLTALEHAHVELVAQAYARFRSMSVQRIYSRLLEQP